MVFRSTVCLFFLVLFVPLVPAQTVWGSIRGIVIDPSGKPIAGARVEVVERNTGKRNSTVSGAEGEFLLNALSPGAYELSIEQHAFRRSVQTLALEVDQQVYIGAELLLGQRTDQVSVLGTEPLTQPETATIGGVIETRSILGLPLDGRNFYELSLLLPGVVPPAPGSGGSVRGDFAINVDGAREDANNFLLDGVYNGDPKLNGSAVNPPVDAIREFEVAANAYDAAFGRNAGGQVNVVTKSGTNQVHGTLYEFFRNATLDARNFFAAADQPTPAYQRNQYGASIGAPIVKNRTFVFGDFQGQQLREGITRIANVPTVAERNGDFSQSANLLLNPLNGQPFPGNRIPQSYQSPVGAAIAALYPLPNRSVAGQNFISSPVQRDNEDQFDLRADHAVSPRSDISARYSFSDRRVYEPFVSASDSVLPGYGVNLPRRAQNAMISETHVFTPSLINEMRAGFDRVALHLTQEGVSSNKNAQIGLPVISRNPHDHGLSFITIPGFSPIGDDATLPQRGITNDYEYLDHLSWNCGRHLVRFGFDFRILQQNAYRDADARGFLSFSGSLLGNSLAELLLGYPTTTGVARLDNAEHIRGKSYSGFAQDNFRIHSDVALTVGMRYEYNTPPVDAQNRANLFDPSRQSLVRVGTDGMPRGGVNPDRRDFAPRVGVAWSVNGSGKTVIRSGYGIYYDQPSLAPSEGIYFSPPYFDQRVFFSIPGVYTLTLQDPFPGQFPLGLPLAATAFQRDMRTPYLQHWNFSVQRQFGSNRMVEAAYVASKGTRLYQARDINQPHPSDAPTYQRPIEQFDTINELESGGNSSYNSFQARFEQRFRRTLSALISYTYAKSLDNASGVFTSTGDPNFPQNSYDLQAERGLSNFDVRHRMVISYGYDLPFHGKLLGGWQTFGILTFQTGRPVTVALLPDFDNSNTGNSNILGFGANDRPDAVHNPNLANPSPERWFDSSAFVIPPRGNFGNAGRNIVEGPGSQTVDVSLIKNTSVAERVKLQCRLEVFNLLNHTNYGLPDNFIGSPTFGQVTSADNPRRIQVGLKLLF